MPDLRRNRFRGPQRSPLSLPHVFAENCCDRTDCSRRTCSKQCTLHRLFNCVVCGSSRARCSPGGGIQGIMALMPHACVAVEMPARGSVKKNQSERSNLPQSKPATSFSNSQDSNILHAQKI